MPVLTAAKIILLEHSSCGRTPPNQNLLRASASLVDERNVPTCGLRNPITCHPFSYSRHIHQTHSFRTPRRGSISEHYHLLLHPSGICFCRAASEVLLTCLQSSLEGHPSVQCPLASLREGILLFPSTLPTALTALLAPPLSNTNTLVRRLADCGPHTVDCIAPQIRNCCLFVLCCIPSTR